MSRNFLKRYQPDPKRFAEHRYLRMLSGRLSDANLWHLNRRSVAGATAWGLFCAFIPLPAQMLIAGAGAVWLRVNVWISVAMVWVTNPITIPPIFYFAYRIGAWSLGHEPLHFEEGESATTIVGKIFAEWEPFLLGCLICGLVSALVGYVSVRLLWRMHLVSRWRARRARRAAAANLNKA
ncbi:MAG: DUF2062 domain-containing protein [Chromatiales bacterium]|nr:DUF2062 domain-containing protein [Chromatiales bacterium]